MDRDVYLILVGAGISLASSIVTLVLKFYLDLYAERVRKKREKEERRRAEIRGELTRRDVMSVGTLPMQFDSLWERFVWESRYKNRTRGIFVGVLVFIGWIVLKVM